MIKRKDLQRTIPSGIASPEDRGALHSFPSREGTTGSETRKSDVLLYGTDRYRLVTPFLPPSSRVFLLPRTSDPD